MITQLDPPEVRMSLNWTMGRRKPTVEPPGDSDAARSAASVHRAFPRPAE